MRSSKAPPKQKNMGKFYPTPATPSRTWPPSHARWGVFRHFCIGLRAHIYIKLYRFGSQHIQRTYVSLKVDEGDVDTSSFVESSSQWTQPLEASEG